MVAIAAENTFAKGFYWNYRNGRTVRLDQDGVLPTEHQASYLRVPLPLLVMTGPVLGLLFVMFLPVMTLLMATTAPALMMRKRARARAAALISRTAPDKLEPVGQRVE